MILFLVMLALGIVLGFIGAGGSGFIIAILVTGFDVPVHLALGTAVTVMFFSVLVGSATHYKGKNLALKQGVAIGLFGAIGAYVGSRLTRWMDPELLLICTMLSLLISGIVLWLKTKISANEEGASLPASALTFKSTVIGLLNGFVSGTFGIGAASFIQISLIKWLNFPLRLAAGTTMLIILPISLLAALGFIQNGFIDLHLFLKVALAVMIGTFIGSKLTVIFPQNVLRYGMILTPVASAVLIFIGLIESLQK